MPGMQIHELLDRIIIGPTDYPDVVRKAYIEKLREFGAPDPEQKVIASEILERHRKRKTGWGTWIRTRTNGVRVRGSTVNLFPSRRGHEPRGPSGQAAVSAAL